MFYATSKAAVYSAAPLGINPDENIALIKLQKNWFGRGVVENPFQWDAKQPSEIVQ